MVSNAKIQTMTLVLKDSDSSTCNICMISAQHMHAVSLCSICITYMV